MRVLIAATMMLASSVVAAHDFYEPWCCNNKDCKPYSGEVKETPSGYYLPEFNQTIPYKNGAGISRPAPEAGTRYDIPEGVATQYYICVMPWEPTVVRCFGAKTGGV